MKFRQGFQEVIVGIIGGIIFSAILGAFAQDETIPSGTVLLFTLIGLVGTIATINSYRTSGFIFNLGWIAGAWILKDALDTTSFLVYFIAPIVVMIIRIVILIKNP